VTPSLVRPCWLVMWVCLPLASVEAQIPPAAPEAPALPAQEHVIRHRLSVKVLDEEAADSLKRAMSVLQAERDRLEPDKDNLEIARIERELSLLAKQLATAEVRMQIESGKDAGLAEIDLPNLGVPKIRIDLEGNVRGSTPPDARTWKRRKGDRIGFFDPVFVESSEFIEGNAVAIFGNIHVGGYVEEQAVSIGGDIFVDGVVERDVIAPFGHVYLSSTAEVAGDIVAARVFADDGSTIAGTIQETSLPRIPGLSGRDGLSGLTALLALLALSVALIGMLLGFLALGVARSNVALVEEHLRLSPLGSFFGGFALQLIAFPVWVLLVITIIGIPVAILAMPLLLLAALVLGFVAFSSVFGRALLRRKTSAGTPWTAFAVGGVLLHLPLIIGLLLGRPETDLSSLFANVLILIGFAVLYLAGTTGFGAAMLSRLGTRVKKDKKRLEAPSGPVGMPPPPDSPGRSPMPAPPGPRSEATS